MSHHSRNIASSLRNNMLILAIAVICNSFTLRTTFTRLPIRLNYVDTDAALVDEKLYEDVNNGSLIKETKSTENIKINEKSIVTTKKTKSFKNNKNSKSGIFTPVVKIAKTIFGEKEIKKIRNDFISFHSSIITSFTKTSESKFGNIVLASLFGIADQNHDGVLDEEEVQKGLNILGFEWIGWKQASGILNRSDNNNDGVIDFEEFEKGAPKTFQTNLKKLAKKNGEKMGLLS